MLVSPGVIGSGLLLYLLLALTTVGVGLGLLRMTRVQLPPASKLALASVVTLAFWAVAIGIAVGLRIPVRLFCGPLWFLSLALAVYGLAGISRTAFQYSRSEKAGPDSSLQKSHDREAAEQAGAGWGTVLVVLGLPLVVLFPFFLDGLQDHHGSNLPDGWSYVAYGQYLWEHPRGTGGGLSPLHQYASHLSHTRYIASSLLGFFSPIFSAGDTQRSSGLFLSWTLFVFTSGCAFFGLVYHLKRYSLVAFLLFTVVSGWVYNLIWANNYDNALALAYFPALIGLVSVKPRTVGPLMLTALLAAGLLYSYPEFAVVVLGASTLVFVNRSWASGDRTIRTSLELGIILLVMLLLTSPYFAELVSFFKNQAADGLKSGGRPGEGMFNGLVSLRFQPSAFWAMGGEYEITSWLPGQYRIEEWLPLRNVVAALFSGLVIVGSLSLWNKSHVGMLISLVVLIGGALFFIGVAQYSYGAYKIIVLAWWPICFCLVRGAEVAAGWLQRRGRSVTAQAYVLLWLVAVPFQATAAAKNLVQGLNLAEFRKVEEVKNLTAGKSIVVMVDDWVADQWAVYFLRDAPIILKSYRMYMAQPHVRPLMQQAREPRLEDSSYILTDANFNPGMYEAGFWSLVWSGGPYRLWNPVRPDWVLVTDLENPNGIERLDGRHFFWLGNAAATMKVISTQSGPLEISGDFLPGPSLPERARRELMIRNDGFARSFSLGAGNSRLVVPVHEGENAITMHVLDRASVPVIRGDRRQLLLGIKGVKVKFGEGATVEKIENANGLEQLDGEPFFWVGKGVTAISVYSSSSGELNLRAYLIPGPSLPDVPRRRVLITADRGYRSQVSLGAGEQSIKLPIAAGRTTIGLAALDAATVAVQPNGDRRPLLVGVRGLKVELDQPQFKR